MSQENLELFRRGLRSPATLVRRRFLVRAMASVALHLCWAGRGLAARVVYDAHDLAHAAAAARVHRGTPVSDDRLRLRTAALAEHFSDGRHERPASDPHVPLPGCTCREWATWRRRNNLCGRRRPGFLDSRAVRPARSVVVSVPRTP